MKPQGLIYKSGANESGEISISLSKNALQMYKFARLIGASLFSLSLSSIIMYYGPALVHDISKINFTDNKPAEVSASYQEPIKEAPVVSATHNSEKESIVEKEINVTQFSLSIPKISANSNVIYNVDPFSEDVYSKALKEGVAHAKDTALPGQGKRIYMFAHSTNSPLYFTEFNAVFYQLRELAENDEIVVSLNGKEFKYIVKQKLVVSATDTSWLTSDAEGEELVLQTCDPPGTTLRRLLIIAKPA